MTADDNILPILRTEVVDNRLVVRPDLPIRPKRGIIFRVSVPDLKLVTVDGAAEITLSGIQNDKIRFDLNGAAQVTAQGETKQVGCLLGRRGVYPGGRPAGQ